MPFFNFPKNLDLGFMITNDRKSNKKPGDKPVTPNARSRHKAKVEAPATETGVPKKKRLIKPKATAVVAEVAENNAPQQIDHPESDIKNMEVHHHPQLDHKPKPIKEYLLEGFMIFIAVMMGFIAENIREGIDNGEHAKQLTTQLVQDLKADTTQLNVIYREETKIAKHNDTLINLLQQPLAKADTRRIQKLVADSHSLWLFHPSAGAIGAIKNELHLKQFSNSKIIGYFAQYEKHIELLHTDQDINLQYQRLYLDPFLTKHFTPANMVAAFSDARVTNSQMRDLTQQDMDQLATDMVLIRIITNEMLKDNGLIKSDAKELLQYVIKQYGVEGE
jgi:hypothetical protein